MFGIWPGGDFRYDPTHYTATKILIALAAAAAVGGAVYALWRRRIRLPLVGGTVVIAVLILWWQSSPWLTGKALATASPFMVGLALVGAAGLAQTGYRIPGAIVGGVLAAAVIYSNVLAYHAVWLAPRGQLLELQKIGQVFAGQGPALMTEYQPYGVRHLLRNLDAEGASELRVHQVPLANGQVVPPGQYEDIDQFRYPDLLYYRTLILRRSPVESRPGAPYQLVLQGQVLRRLAAAGERVLERARSTSRSATRTAPSAVPSCSSVLQLGKTARAAHGRLAAATTPNPIFVPLAAGPLPARLDGFPADPYYVTPSGSATMLAKVTVPRVRSLRRLDQRHDLASPLRRDRREACRRRRRVGRAVRAARPDVPHRRHALRDDELRQPDARPRRQGSDLPAGPARAQPRRAARARRLRRAVAGVEPLRQVARLARGGRFVTRLNRTCHYWTWYGTLSRSVA